MWVSTLLIGLVPVLLLKGSPTSRTRLDEPGHLRVRCPVCSWQPRKSDRWLCSPGCLHRWNTFETAGICPGCTRTWEETACLRCEAWSRHEDWYVHGER